MQKKETKKEFYLCFGCGEEIPKEKVFDGKHHYLTNQPYAPLFESPDDRLWHVICGQVIKLESNGKI